MHFNQREIVNLPENGYFGMFVNDCFNWYHKCGRQIILFTVVVVKTCEILLFIFFEEAVIVEETFWNVYVNVAEKYFYTLSFYGTSSEYSYNTGQWSKDTCQM